MTRASLPDTECFIFMVCCANIRGRNKFRFEVYTIKISEPKTEENDL